MFSYIICTVPETYGLLKFINIRMNLGEMCWGVDWMHLDQDRTSGGLLWTRYWTIGFYKRRRISWLAEWL